MTNEQEIVWSVFGVYLNDLKAYSTKPDRPTFKRLEEVRDRAIKALEQTRWHPASEEPPKKDTDYIITYQWKGWWSGYLYKEVEVCRYYNGGLWDVSNNVKVLAWRELPESYEEEKDGKNNTDND